MEKLDEGWYECVEDFYEVPNDVFLGDCLDKAYKSFNRVFKDILKI